MRKSLGITLTELLIAQVLGLLLVGVALTAFIQIQSHVEYIHSLLLQRFHAIRAYQLLSDAINHAGLMGCRSLQQRKAVSVSSHFLLPSYSGIEIIPTHASHLRTIIPYHCEPIRSQSDILMIQYAKPFGYLSNETRRGSVLLNFRQTRHPRLQDVMIADCENAEWILEPRMVGNTFFLQHPLFFDYSAESVLANWVTVFYFLGKTQSDDSTEIGTMALYQRECHGRSEEIIQGVDKMDLMLSSTGLHVNLILRHDLGGKTLSQRFQFFFNTSA